MIRNRLSVLLAERGLKITKVAKDTGISRNTITSTAQNDGKMIQLETINTLCTYLGVNPGNFFEFIPYDVEFSIFTNAFDIQYDHLDYEISNIYPSDFEFDLFIKVKGKTDFFEASLVGSLEGKEYDENINCNVLDVIVTFDSDDNKERTINFFNELSPGFSNDLEKQIEELIHKELFNQIDSYCSDENNDVSEREYKFLTDNILLHISADGLINPLPF